MSDLKLAPAAAPGHPGRFAGRVLELALPISFQQLVMAGLNVAVSLVVGRLGDVPLAAVGLAGQVFFLLNLVLFGVGSGASIFGAQFWGQRDVANIRRVLGLALLIAVSAGGVFTVLMLGFPAWALGIYTRDPAVIALGAAYLRIAGVCCVFWSVSICYATMLRSVGEVRLPMLVGVTSLALNLALSYALALGHFGLPRLGALGAAYGLAVSRILECVLLVGAAYWRRTPLAAPPRDLFRLNRALVSAVLYRMLPVALNEILWSFGTTTYSVIFARLGTDAIAALNIVAVFDNLAFVPFIGLGSAAAIIVGHAIGAGELDRAFRQGGLVVAAAVGVAVLEGALLAVAGGFVVRLYNVSPATAAYARQLFFWLGVGLFIKTFNFTSMVGVLRAGGDTRFALVLDGTTIWGVGVTLALFGAFVLHLPAPLVYALTLGDEVVKGSFALYRYLSRRWIHRLTQAPPPHPAE